ncbi:transmembrane 6 superfamily member 1-like [Sinocyclocheilus grahami]|uniref:transmembrane 6 superfamily member 1-like n=1 Tax=Sinocyclocheilus grahami TaxID=75366 RepID=UPI0007AD1DA1|nr:PREDICTED: transmembrane 6 superfamily member 1-like [Sinocyclocheilus grahami]
MDFPPEISVFILSLTAPFILYTINHVPFLQDPQVILAIGIMVLTTIFLLANRSVKSTKSTDPLYYVFAVFSFTSVVSITNALQHHGFIKGFMDFYISKVRSLSHTHTHPHTHTHTHTHTMTCYLRCCAVGFSSYSKPFRSLALVWAGSMIASQIVLITGVVVGKYGKNLPAFWRNAPSLVLPIWAAAKLFNRPRELSIIPADKVKFQMIDSTVLIQSSKIHMQWTHLGASVHSRTPFTYRIPKDEWRQVVTLNLLYTAVPVLLAVRCYMDQTFFMKSVPQEQASNGKKKN